jgi:hypothetical protein
MYKSFTGFACFYMFSLQRVSACLSDLRPILKAQMAPCRIIKDMQALVAWSLL